MKSLLIAFAFSVVASAQETENKLSMHLDCNPNSGQCLEIGFEGDLARTIWVMKNAEMTVSQGDLEDASLEKGEYGDEHLRLNLNKAAAGKLEQLTKNNVGKRLVVVANGRALIDPTIQQEITTGSFQITAGRSGNAYLDNIPWLRKMIEDKKKGEERLGTFSMISYLILGILLIFGAIHFAFFRGRSAE
jgi:hypothetical protein